MKLLKHSLFISFFSISFCNSQTVINAETLRVSMLQGTENWSGSAGLNFSIAKNVNNIFNISTSIGIGYNGDNDLWMIISNLNFNKQGGQSFANSGSQHFRYNRELNKTVTMEAFLQGQYDKISNISFRGLAGIGPRFDLSKNDEVSKKNKNRARIFIGTLLMYEHEKAEEPENTIIQNDIRSSNYLSFTIPLNGIKITSTTYFQPKLDLLKDYRISNDLSIKIKFPKKEVTTEKTDSSTVANTSATHVNSFWENLSFNINFNYNFDAFPVSSIPKSQYELSNGITYNF